MYIKNIFKTIANTLYCIVSLPFGIIGTILVGMERKKLHEEAELNRKLERNEMAHDFGDILNELGYTGDWFFTDDSSNHFLSFKLENGKYRFYRNLDLPMELIFTLLDTNTGEKRFFRWSRISTGPSKLVSKLTEVKEQDLNRSDFADNYENYLI